MSASRPSVFIASAQEDIEVVRALGVALADRGAVVRDWKVRGNFPPGQTLLHPLLKLVRNIDFGICVAGPHDVVESKGTTLAAPRDNVLLELGMLLGAIGSERTFVLVPRGVPLKLPSDYQGITHVAYEPPGANDSMADVISSLTVPVGRIWAAIVEQTVAVPSTVLGGHHVIGAHAGRFAARAGLMRIEPGPDPQVVETTFEAETGPRECEGSPQRVYDALVECITDVLAAAGDAVIDNVVIAVPGVIDARGRRLRVSATALPPDEQVASTLASRLLADGLDPARLGAKDVQGVCARIHLDNDAKAVARYDQWSRAQDRRRDSLLLLVDEGLGGALVLDGGLYYGALGAAGEVGHQTIGLGTEVLQTRWLELDEVVEACPCGGHGVHWENVCDAQGFLALAAHLDPVAYERFSDGSSRPSSVDRFTAFIANVAGGLADTSQGPDTSEALRSYCDRLVRTYAEALAIGMSNLVNVLDVEQLVLTGRVVTTLKDVEWPVGAPPITDFRKHLRDTLRSVILRDHLPVLEYQDVAWSDLWKGAALATRDTRYSHLMLGTAGTRP